MVYAIGDISVTKQLNKPGVIVEYAAEKVSRGDSLVAVIGKCGEDELRAIKSARQKSVITVLYPTSDFEPLGDIFESSEIIMLSEQTTNVCTGIYPDCEVNLALAAKKLRSYGATNIVITVADICTAVIVGQEITLVPCAEAVGNALDINFAAAVAGKLSAGGTLIDSIKREV